MCGGFDPKKILDPAGLWAKDKTPDVQTTDPQAEADAAARKKRKQGSSLLASGAGGTDDSGTSLLGSGAAASGTKRSLGA